MLQKMLDCLTNLMRTKLENFEKEIDLNNYSVLYNYSIFFMILILNLKSNKTFLFLLFEKDSKLIKILLNILKNSSKYKNSNKISKILCNLFLSEYKDIFFSHKDPFLEELFISNFEKFSKVNIEGTDVFPKKIYSRILDNIINLKLSFEAIFENLTNSNQCDLSGKKKTFEYQDSDKPTGK
jgi:hypothetical protein